MPHGSLVTTEHIPIRDGYLAGCVHREHLVMDPENNVVRNQWIQNRPRLSIPVKQGVLKKDAARAGHLSVLKASHSWLGGSGPAKHMQTDLKTCKLRVWAHT